jgi:hypothetical protein
MSETTIFQASMFPDCSAAPKVRRSRVTNNPTVRANQSTSAGRRVVDLFKSFMTDMNNPTSATAQANALEAAELVAACETARAALLAGTGGNTEQLVRLQNLAHRAVRRLGINPQRRGAATPDLKTYLAERAAQQDRGE